MSLVKCSECGKEISDKASSCPHCGCPVNVSDTKETITANSKEEKPKKKGSCLKTVLIVIAVFIVLMVLIGVIFGGDDNPEVEKTGEVSSESDNEDVQEEVSNVFSVGDIVETDDLRITFVSAEPYTSDNEFLQPKDGYEYWKFEFAFENISDTDQSISSMLNWECYADDTMTDQTWIGDENGLDGTLSPGRKTEGAVYFEIPSGAESIEVEYDINFWMDDKIVFVAK